jgi:hypothetical protein
VAPLPLHRKAEPTFADVLAGVRRLAWREVILADPGFMPGVGKLTPEARDLMIEALASAA